MYDDFTRRLRLICEVRGLGPVALSELVGGDKGSASRWLHGKRRPKMRIEELVAHFGISVSQFYTLNLRDLKRVARKAASS